MTQPQRQDPKIDFTILFQKVQESERDLPDLTAEVRQVRKEADEIRELRRVVERVSNEAPRTLTLS